MVTNSTNDKIRGELTEVDALLCEMISPEAKQIPESLMRERWSWPSVDLDDLLEKELW